MDILIAVANVVQVIFYALGISLAVGLFIVALILFIESITSDWG